MKKTEDNFVYKWLPCAKKSQSSLSITLNLYIQKAFNCLHNFYAYQTNLLISRLLWKMWIPHADTPIITGCPSASWNVFKTIVWGASSIFPSPNNQIHSKVEVWVHQSVRSKIIIIHCNVLIVTIILQQSGWELHQMTSYMHIKWTRKPTSKTSSCNFSFL